MLECVIMWNHYAFVHFGNLCEAKRALEALHGSTFSGKRIIVQLSTSANRPLPKCLALGGNGITKANASKRSTSQTKSTTTVATVDNINAFVRATDLEQTQFSCASAPRNSSENGTNWIQALKNGSLPVVLKEKRSNNEIDLALLPTPKMPEISNKIPGVVINPMVNSSSSRSSEETDTEKLRRLIENINNSIERAVVESSGCNETVADEDQTCEIFDSVFDMQSNVTGGNDDDDKQNEQILIDRLNMLTYSRGNDVMLKQIWNCNGGSNENGEKSLYTRSASATSTCSSSSGVFSRSPSPSNRYTIDFLNKKCVYAENRLTGSLNQSGTKVVRQQQQHPVVNNYILFPEIREQSFSSAVDYQSALVDLLRKAII